MGLRPGAMMLNQSSATNRPVVFNYAIKGGLVTIQLVCLQNLLSEGIHPDLVLLETYPPFYLDIPKNDPAKILEHFAPHRFHRRDLDVVTRHTPDPDQVRQDWLMGQVVPWHFHRNFLVNWYLPRWAPDSKRINFHHWHTDEWGWDTCPKFYEHAKTWYRTPQYYDDVRNIAEGWSKPEIHEDLHRTLCELVALCRREKIDVALVWPPETSASPRRLFARPS